MKLTNNFDVGLSVAVWLASDFYDHNVFPGKKAISATAILKPVRQVILGQRAYKDDAIVQEQDIINNIESRSGTAVHDSIEKAWLQNYRQALLDLGKSQHLIDRIILNPTPEQLAKTKDAIPVYLEQRAHKVFGDWVVHGQFDFIGGGILEDFKNVKIFGYMKQDKEEQYRQQGSIYRWLNQEKITAKFMRINFLIKDWKAYEYKYKKDKGYPAAPVITKEYGFLDIADTETLIQTQLDLLDLYTKAPEADIPECPPEELWQFPATFKYYKDPNKTKRSSGNFDTYHEAHQLLIQNNCGIIKEIKGVIKRCNPKWCPAFKLCSQKDGYEREGLLDL